MQMFAFTKLPRSTLSFNAMLYVIISQHLSQRCKTTANHNHANFFTRRKRFVHAHV